MTLAIMNRQQVWKVVGVLLLAVGLQLYAQQADIDAAAAAKARAGREALTHAPIDFQAPKAVGTFITFDAPGAGTGINPAGVIMGLYIDANNVYHGFLLLPRP
jgi:hypothetical protein